MEINALHIHILKHIQGVFGEDDMQTLKEEIEKLQPGDVYVEVGVDEGRSARVAHEYANPDVFKLYVDIHNVDPHPASIGRGAWMEQEGMVGIGKKGFFVHGDGDEFAKLFVKPFVNLIFLDPHHDYDSIKSCTLAWEPLVKTGGVMLFHDYDHPGTKQWLDEHYPEKEILHSKIARVIRK